MDKQIMEKGAKSHYYVNNDVEFVTVVIFLAYLSSTYKVFI